MWLGDFPEDFTTVTCMFTTHSSTGAPVAPSTALENADVLIFKNGSATEKTSQNGVTMTSPFNTTTGLHCLTIDTSNDTGDGGFWVAGAVYTLVLVPDETVDSVAVAKVIGQFGIELSNVLRPTTAGRKLDVSAGGEAGIDWANIGSPTTAVNLSNTSISETGVITGFAGEVRSAIGMVGIATYDTDISGLESELALIKAKTDNLPVAPAATGDAMTLTAAYDPAKTAATQASVNTIDDFLDTEIAAIKTKTDSLTFTVAGQVDSNIQYVNDVQVNGDGQTGTEWGP